RGNKREHSDNAEALGLAAAVASRPQKAARSRIKVMNTFPTDPVHLTEDAETGDRFLIYGTEKGVRVELKYEAGTLWMTQPQIAVLYGVDRTVITKHLSNIYSEQELDPGSTSAKIAQVRKEGLREVVRQLEHYNLDAIISVGYRVSSAQGTQFRKWA